MRGLERGAEALEGKDTGWECVWRRCSAVAAVAVAVPAYADGPDGSMVTGDA